MTDRSDRSRPRGPVAFEAVKRRIFDAYGTGQFEDALALTRVAEPLYPENADRLLFWAACFHALLGRADAALRDLQRCLQRGFWWAPAVFEDADLDSIRHDPRFSAIVRESSRRYEKAQAAACVELAIGDCDIEPPPLLLALPMRSSNAWETLPHWVACEARALVVAVGSSQLLGSHDRSWDDFETSREDLWTAFEQAIGTCSFDGRIVLGGASQGAARAVQFALAGDPVGARGFVAVVPTFGLDITVALEEIRPLLPRAAGKGVRGAFILGSDDAYLPQAEEVIEAMRDAGLPLEAIRLEGMGHEYPAPEILGDALDFVLD